MTARFQLGGDPTDMLDALERGPVAVTRPPASPGPLSFAAAAEPASRPGAPCWQVDLSEDLEHAAAELARGDQRVADLAVRLDNARAQLVHAVDHMGARPGEAAWAMPDELALLVSGAGARPAGGPISFGIDPDWSAMASKAEAALEGIWRLVRYPSWVETRRGSVLLARTAVSWSGDTRSLTTPLLTPAVMRIHARSVSLAVRSRNAWARLLLTLMSGSARLASMAATPAGAAMALPMAWRFIRRVLAETQALRRLQG